MCTYYTHTRAVKYVYSANSLNQSYSLVSIGVHRTKADYTVRTRQIPHCPGFVKNSNRYTEPFSHVYIPL